MQHRLTQWMWGGIDWLFPPVCGGCNRAGFRWCPDCQNQIVSIPEPACTICGLPISYVGKCDKCQSRKPPFKSLRSWVVFEGPIRNALHTMKYRRNLGLGEVLAHHMADYVFQLNWLIDVIVPVPLGRKRLQERGYNQVGLVAKPLAVITGLEYLPRCLIRTRDTKSQVGLTAEERRENMRNAFYAESRLVSGQTILIVDDVATTGATISACAEALLDADAKNIYALTITRALPNHGLQIV